VSLADDDNVLGIVVVDDVDDDVDGDDDDCSRLFIPYVRCI